MPLLLNPAPPEIEELLAWAEHYPSNPAPPDDSVDYENAADYIAALNAYLVHVEVAEFRRGLVEAMGQAASGFNQVAIEWEEARRRGMETLDKIAELGDFHTDAIERKVTRRALFMSVTARQQEIVSGHRRNQTRLRHQSRHHVRAIKRTGVRQIICR